MKQKNRDPMSYKTNAVNKRRKVIRKVVYDKVKKRLHVFFKFSLTFNSECMFLLTNQSKTFNSLLYF